MTLLFLALFPALVGADFVRDCRRQEKYRIIDESPRTRNTLTTAEANCREATVASGVTTKYVGHSLFRLDSDSAALALTATEQRHFSAWDPSFFRLSGKTTSGVATSIEDFWHGDGSRANHLPDGLTFGTVDGQAPGECLFLYFNGARRLLASLSCGLPTFLACQFLDDRIYIATRPPSTTPSRILTTVGAVSHTTGEPTHEDATTKAPAVATTQTLTTLKPTTQQPTAPKLTTQTTTTTQKLTSQRPSTLKPTTIEATIATTKKDPTTVPNIGTTTRKGSGNSHDAPIPTTVAITLAETTADQSNNGQAPSSSISIFPSDSDLSQNGQNQATGSPSGANNGQISNGATGSTDSPQNGRNLLRTDSSGAILNDPNDSFGNVNCTNTQNGRNDKCTEGGKGGTRLAIGGPLLATLLVAGVLALTCCLIFAFKCAMTSRSEDDEKGDDPKLRHSRQGAQPGLSSGAVAPLPSYDDALSASFSRQSTAPSHAHRPPPSPTIEPLPPTSLAYSGLPPSGYSIREISAEPRTPPSAPPRTFRRSVSFRSDAWEDAG